MSDGEGRLERSGQTLSVGSSHSTATCGIIYPYSSIHIYLFTGR